MEKHVITGATTAQAQRLAKNLEGQEVYLTDYNPIPQVLLKSGRFLQLSLNENNTYVHELLKVCLDVQASYLHIIRPQERDLIQGQEVLFEEYGIQVLIEVQ